MIIETSSTCRQAAHNPSRHDASYSRHSIPRLRHAFARQLSDGSWVVSTSDNPAGYAYRDEDYAHAAMYLRACYRNGYYNEAIAAARGEG